MKIFFSASAIVSFLFIFATVPARALSVDIVDKNGRTLVSAETVADLNRSVGAITVDVLTKSKEGGALNEFEAYEEGLVSINGFGNEVELVSKTEVKAWGWCYAINGRIGETLTDQTYFSSQGDRLTWFYGYALYRDGSWIAQCLSDALTNVSSSPQKKDRM